MPLFDYYSEFVFEAFDTEGAILMMPNGSLSQDLLNSKAIEKYVKDNAETWYEYVTNKRGRMVNNGDIRLVIGFDKVSSWGIATFAKTVGQQVRLEFKKTKSGNRGYRWNCIGTGNGRVGPSNAEMCGLQSDSDPSPLQNQCVFVRTMNFTLSGELWNKSAVHQVRSGIDSPSDSAPTTFPFPGGSSSQSDSTLETSRLGQTNVTINSIPLSQPVGYTLC